MNISGNDPHGPSARDRQRAKLREFLRSRRERLSPAQAGLPETGRRRTPGLRREEVAVLAGVGVSWYTWLEQGRDIKVSGDVLDAVARALLLDAVERHTLPPRGPQPATARGGAVGASVSPRCSSCWTPGRPDPATSGTATGISPPSTMRPAGYSVTATPTTTAWSPTSPMPATAYCDEQWEQTAPAVAAGFRADSARYPDDPEFDRIAADLAQVSPEFAELWDRHDAAEHTAAVKAVEHPEAGTAGVRFHAVAGAGAPRPSPDPAQPTAGPTAERLERLMAQPGGATPTMN